MNIENIAIVRATNIIPIDGTVIPISEDHYIEKNRNQTFQKEMTRLLMRKGLITPIDHSQFDNPKYREEKDKEIAEITNKYIPYSSNYNSMILFSLNGIVPDDNENGFGNNIFSNKKCGIVDNLAEHIDNVISLNPTDTAIKITEKNKNNETKKSLKLSNQAIIFIEKNTYENLSIEDKNKLSKLNVRLFEGSLKEAIESYLKNSKKYTCEKPVLSLEKGGFLESPTSEELKKTIKKIAEERNISTAAHLNILLHNTEITEGLKSVQNEQCNIHKIKEYYKLEFFKFLFSKMPINEELKYYLLNYNSDIYIEELCEVINDYGLEKYKKICDIFNYTLEFLCENKILPTPSEIIDSINKGTPISLYEIISNFNNEENISTQYSQENKISKKK